MKNNLREIFVNLGYEKPETDLADKVFSVIQLKSRRRERLKLGAFSLAGGLSLIALYPAFKDLSRQIVQSGLFQYFSLIFSDSATLVSYWKEFALSILESTPLTSLALCLSLIFVFMGSLKFIASRINFRSLLKTA